LQLVLLSTLSSRLRNEVKYQQGKSG